ncbi:hypothetical protein I79_009052 [Cricetulus griseus]|uniref:Uncharacterized protein n=1 Tax=Cricetulus griseus TaxID=10029 RepID=G3HEQ9_CRIGR|nr:hypothetical protein I79_009052 [Cricetulus griseus]
MITTTKHLAAPNGSHGFPETCATCHPQTSNSGWQILPAECEAYCVLIVGSHHHLCLGSVLQLFQNIVEAPGTGTVLHKLASRPTTTLTPLGSAEESAVQDPEPPSSLTSLRQP